MEGATGAQRRKRGRLAGEALPSALGSRKHYDEIIAVHYLLGPLASFPKWTHLNNFIHHCLDFLNEICAPSGESVYPKLRPLAEWGKMALENDRAIFKL